MADYGIDAAAVTDRGNPDALASWAANLANALARRLLTTNGALLAIGDDAPYETINLRDWLGARPTADQVRVLNGQMQRVLSQDERVNTVSAAATFAAGVLSVAVSGTGAAGPFSFVLTLDAVTGARLQVNP